MESEKITDVPVATGEGPLYTYRYLTFDVEFRWMQRKHLSEVVELEKQSFPEFPWTRHELSSKMTRDVAYVALIHGRVAGYIIWERHHGRIDIIDLAVAPSARRIGIGAKLVGLALDELALPHCGEIIADVRESNLAAQLLFRSCGFRVVAQMRDHYDATDEAGYRFRYRLPRAVCPNHEPSQPSNRLLEYTIEANPEV